MYYDIVILHNLIRMRRYGIIIFLLFVSSHLCLAQPDQRLISSRHYIGLEFGGTGTMLLGSTNFFISYIYPYSSGSTAVIESLPFSNMGGGFGFHIGAPVDLSRSNSIGLQGKAFYRTNNSSNTEQTMRQCSSSASGAPGIATIEDHYKLSLQYFGAEFALKYQLMSEGLYVRTGIEYTSLISDRISGYEKIISSDNGCEYVYIPSGSLTGKTEVTIAEQPTNGAIRASGWAVKLGLGTYIKLIGDWVITPEINAGIPITELFSDFFVQKYTSGYAIGDPANPTVLKATTPNLWHLTLSVGIKLPIGLKEYDAKDNR